MLYTKNHCKHIQRNKIISTLLHVPLNFWAFLAVIEPDSARSLPTTSTWVDSEKENKLAYSITRNVACHKKNSIKIKREVTEIPVGNKPNFFRLLVLLLNVSLYSRLPTLMVDAARKMCSYIRLRSAFLSLTEPCSIPIPNALIQRTHTKKHYNYMETMRPAGDRLAS